MGNRGADEQLKTHADNIWRLAFARKASIETSRVPVPVPASISTANANFVAFKTPTPGSALKFVGRGLFVLAGRDARIAGLGNADDRARLRIELAEAMKRGGEFFRQNR
jgi:hypothetical protein